jgi:hypothetical protein
MARYSARHEQGSNIPYLRIIRLCRQSEAKANASFLSLAADGTKIFGCSAVPPQRTYLPLTSTDFYLTPSVFPFDAPPAQPATLQMDGAGEL